MQLFLLVYAINLSTFKYEIMNNCIQYTPETALSRFNEIVKLNESNGFRCTKVPDLYSYSCEVNGKLVAIELHKNKNICKAVPAKTVRQMKFLIK